MIARLTGTLVEKSPNALILDINGVGYEVLSSLGTYQKLPSLGECTVLHIYTHVREDDIILFGFHELTEKQLFKKLIKVNGVGPKLALNVLSGISAADLIQSLLGSDLIRITAIPGIGKKTAERMILDLKDKVVDLIGEGAASRPDSDTSGQFRDDLISVLTNLGYKRPLAERALHDISFDEESTLQDAVRLTLRHLGDATARRANAKA